MGSEGEGNPNAIAAPTPEQVLRWIAAGTPWFPAQFAEKSGIPRDAFDSPLAELRTADLVRIVDWVRGVGQAYSLTPSGDAALQALVRPPAPVLPTPEIPQQGRSIADMVECRTPMVVPALVLANLLAYVVGVGVAIRNGIPIASYLLHGDRDLFMRLGAAAAPPLLHGEWWRLLLCCFVHGSIWHLLINVLNLAMVGSLAELLWGRWRVLCIYLVAGWAGNCLTLALVPGAILIGASGAIWGLAASVAAWMVVVRRRLHRAEAAELARRLSFGFALGIAVSLLPHIGWQAHLGGAIAGFLTALLLSQARSSRLHRAAAIAIAALAPAACLVGLQQAIQKSARWEALRQRVPPQPSDNDPAPYLKALNPAAVMVAVRDAQGLLITTPARRSAERTAAVRTGVAELWGKAVEASKRLAPEPGPPELTANRARARAFADARVESLGRLLGMIDSKTIPDIEAWRTWGQRHREADRLWHELEMPPQPSN